jgi:hypothetical protein
MDIKRAKTLHSSVMTVLMHTHGIGNVTNADVLAVKETSLSDILLANNLMNGFKEKAANGGFVHTLSTTDKSLAELFLRVHDPDFMVANEFEEVCNALNDTFEDTINGHGVLIDGSGCYSLIELNSSGDGANETLVTVNTPREIYDYTKRCISAKEFVEN